MTQPIPTRLRGKLRRHRARGFDHTISGLLTKRTHVLNRLKKARVALEAVEDDLAALDRTLAQTGYDGDPNGLMPSRTDKRIFKFGEAARNALDVLRSSGRPLTSREITKALPQAKRTATAGKSLKHVTIQIHKVMCDQVEAGRVRSWGACRYCGSWFEAPEARYAGLVEAPPSLQRHRHGRKGAHHSQGDMQ